MNAPFYLTIDDGPSPYMTEKLALLERHAIPAVWFLIGQNLEARPEPALAAIRRGDILANHSYSHPHFPQTPVAEFTPEVARTDALIHDLYKTANVDRPAKFFRFPYGEQCAQDAAKPVLQTQLRQLGYTAGPFDHLQPGSPANVSGDADWLWSYDVREWTTDRQDHRYTPIKTVQANLATYLQSQNTSLGQVILMHDHIHTHQYFAQLIEQFVAAGVQWALLPKK